MMIAEEGRIVIGSELIPVLFDLCYDEFESVVEGPLIWQFGALVLLRWLIGRYRPHLCVAAAAADLDMRAKAAVRRASPIKMAPSQGPTGAG